MPPIISKLNFVTDQRSQIDGLLNAYQGSQIGGHVYFLNPYGVLIGEAGVINVGRLSLATPTHDFMHNLFPADQMMPPPSTTDDFG